MTTNKQLRELAEKAKSGGWFESGDLHYGDARSGYMHGLHHDEDGFIAAASPDRVLELLDENEALQAECDRLQAENEKLVSYTQNGIECFASPCPDHSGVNTPPFSEFQGRYGGLCLMCVVDELDALQDGCTLLCAAIRRLCNIYVADDYYEGQLREESLDAAVNRAIDAALAAYRKQGGSND